MLDNYDIYADVGGYAGVVKTFIVESDGNIDIDFGHEVQNPAIKAIEILSTGGNSQTAGPLLDAIGDQFVSEGQSVDLAIQSTGLTLSHNGLPSFASLADNGNGDGTLTLAPIEGDAGVYSVTIITSDNGEPEQTASETFSITVAAPLADGTLVYRINAGGETVDDWQADVVSEPDEVEQVEATSIGSRLELFVDETLFDDIQGAELQLHSPTEAATELDQHAAGAYPTVIFDGTTYYHYWRDVISGTTNPEDGTNTEVVRVETSTDGIHWTQPVLNLFTVDVDGPNNVVLAYDAPSMHNFMPFFDTNPDVDPQHKFKAVAGLSHVDSEPADISGIRIYSSPDGLNWTLMANDPVITVDDLPSSNDTFAFDSANVAFWSELEQQYVIYYRTWAGGKPGGGNEREISRAVSNDFINWTDHEDVDANLPGEHLYTSAANPYFRAPQLYVGMPTQFLPNNSNQNTQILFMTSRDGETFDRMFDDEVFIQGLSGNRQNYVAPQIVQTASDEMSLYGSSGIRYTMRLDGFSSLDTTGTSGEATTKAITFDGDALKINFTTGSGGSIRVELLDGFGNVLPGFSLAESDVISGDSVDHIVTWNGQSDVSDLSGEAIHVRFVMENADLYSMQFDGQHGIWLPPQLSIPKGFIAVPGETVTAPLQLTVEDPAGVDVTSVTAAIEFDANAFSVSNIRTAAALSGFNLDIQLNNATGTLVITATGSATNLSGQDAIDLILADFHVHENSRLGDVAINLMSNFNGEVTSVNNTAVELVRGPSNDADDFVDGQISIHGSHTNVEEAVSDTASTTHSIDTSHVSVPQDTPESIFQTERWDHTNGSEMQWDFHVSAGTYEVRLYFAETYSKAQSTGSREFDVSIEGQQVLNNYDVYAEVGGYTAVMKNFIITSDSNLDIDFSHVTQNPALKAIEIVAVAE